jgi:dolichyl-phosphate-mannose--protein O-mannosyl transferase
MMKSKKKVKTLPNSKKSLKARILEKVSGKKINLPKLILFGILIWAFLVRVYRLEIPKHFYFDEVYHAFTAEAYAKNDPAGYEWWHTSPVEGTAYEWLHPPISKLFMALSIKTLGDNSFAWRFPGAIFGVMTIAAVYFLTKKVFKNEKMALVAAGIASLDGLLLTQSRIAMNDIYVTFFMVMALGWYWQANQSKKPTGKELWISGVFTGLAVATKWSGLFVIFIVGLWELGKIISERKIYWRRMIVNVLAFGLVPIMIYLGSFGQFFLQRHTWKQFVELHKQIWWYQTHLQATHTYQSRPKQWVLDLRPVWFYVSYQGDKIGNIYALSNPIISWVGIGAMVVALYRGIVERKKKWLYLFSCYLGLWFPWVWSPRIMFYYHYTPAIPFLSIGIAGLVTEWWQKKEWRWLALGLVGLIFVVFVYFYPHWTGIELPTAWVDHYYWLKSWK